MLNDFLIFFDKTSSATGSSVVAAPNSNILNAIFGFNNPPPPKHPSDLSWFFPNSLALGMLVTPEPSRATFLPLDFYRTPAPPTPKADWTWQRIARQLELLNGLNQAFTPYEWHLQRAPNPPHPGEFFFANDLPGIMAKLTPTVMPYDLSHHPALPISTDQLWMLQNSLGTYNVPPAPIILSGAAVTGITTTTASLTVNTTVGSGTLYWIVSTDSQVPTIAQITAGNDATGSASVASGNQSVSAAGYQTVSATGLLPLTDYYGYFFQDYGPINSNIDPTGEFNTV